MFSFLFSIFVRQMQNIPTAFIWYKLYFHEPRVGTDITGPGKAVFATRQWNFKGIKWKNSNLKNLKCFEFVKIKFWCFLTTETLAQTSELVHRGILGCRIRFWSLKWRETTRNREKNKNSKKFKISQIIKMV